MKHSSTLHFKYLIRFLSIVALVLFVWFFACRSLLPSGYAEKTQRTLLHADSYEVITLGTSHMRGIHFSSLGVAGVHYFDPDANYDEVSFKIREIVPLLKNLKYVFISFAKGSLSMLKKVPETYLSRRIGVLKNTPTLTFDHATLTEYLSFSNKLALYRKLVDSRIFKFHKANTTVKEQLKLLPFLKNSDGANRNALFDVNHRCKKKAIHLPWEDGIKEGYTKTVNYDLCIRRAGRQKAETMIRRNMVESEFLTPVNRNIDTIKEIIGYLSSRNIMPIFISMPVTPYYREALNFTSHLDLLLDDPFFKENAIYIDKKDYFDQSLEDGINDYFFDGDHLSLGGAKIFSRHLASVLQIYGKGNRND